MSRRGQRIDGFVRVVLSDGSSIFYPETTTRADALADARRRGFDTSAVEALEQTT